MSENTKKKIMKAALKEFAAKGFAGARIEAIARRAGANKAMVFYYYANKRNLYKAVIHHSMGMLFQRLKAIFSPQMTPEILLENLPRIYITFFAEYPDLIKVISFDLLQNPANITTTLPEVISSQGILFPKPPLIPMLQAWHKKGILSEADPKQVMMNILGLCLFTFLGIPMIETIFGEKIAVDADFYERRIRSVIRVLKKGMLT